MTTPKELADKAKVQVEALAFAHETTVRKNHHAPALRRDLHATIDQLQAMAEARQGSGEPVAYQYQGREGKWYPFMDERHYENTVAEGSWPIRALYTAPPAAQQATGSGQVLTVDDMARVLQAAWAKAEPDHGVTRDPLGYWATFADMARAALGAAPPSAQRHDAPLAIDAEDEGDSRQALFEAYQRIENAVITLPTFEVRHEGGIEAATQNLVDAINALAARPTTPSAQQATGSGQVLTDADAAWREWVGKREWLLDTRHNENIFRAGFSAATQAQPEVFPVREFGAVGDGVADDTAAFQRAMDAAQPAAPTTGKREPLTREGCHYLCNAGSVCNKCGHVHGITGEQR